MTGQKRRLLLAIALGCGGSLAAIASILPRADDTPPAAAMAPADEAPLGSPAIPDPGPPASAASGPVAPVPIAPGLATMPAWRRFAVPPPLADGKPVITFVIDDMGVNLPQSARAIALPAPLTLSWLPYARRLPEQVAEGVAAGHETMLHMNMEPLGHNDPGPNALRTWLPPAINLAYLRTALDSVPGAVGVNQHEGSVASLSVPLMDLVAGELRDRGLLFLDSLTIPHSVALDRARAAGVTAVARDVFIDNDPRPAIIRAQLAEVEAIARHYGYAIAIGHPRQTTMDVMESYLPGLAARGYVLWPLSATVAAQNHIQLSASAP